MPKSKTEVISARVNQKMFDAVNDFISKYSSTYGINDQQSVIVYALKNLLFKNDIGSSLLRRLDRQKREIQTLTRFISLNTEILLRFIQYSCYTLPDLDSMKSSSKDEQRAFAQKKYMKFIRLVNDQLEGGKNILSSIPENSILLKKSESEIFKEKYNLGYDNADFEDDRAEEED